MYQPVVLYIGLRFACGKSSSTFIRFILRCSTIAISLGVMSMVIVLSVMNGFENELRNSVLGFIPQAILTTSKGRVDPKSMSSSLAKSLPGVTNVTPLITSNVIIQSQTGIAAGLMLGINPKYPEPILDHLLIANQYELLPSKYRIILGYNLATVLNVKLGDTVRLIVPEVIQLTPLGRVPRYRLFTVTGIFLTKSEADHYQLLVNQEDASRMMRYPTGYISGWRLWVKDPFALDRAKIQSVRYGFFWHDWRELKGELIQAAHMEKNMTALLLSLIIVVAIFNVITSIELIITEKRREIAILQTQGLTRKQITMVFLIQGSSSGIIGTVFGAILGVLVAHYLEFLLPSYQLLFNKIEIPVYTEPKQIVCVIASVLTVILISTIYPSYRNSIIYPAKILRYE